MAVILDPKEYSAQMEDVIMRLRRSINDTESPRLDFSDFTLYGYISDAVDELEIGDYKKSIVVQDGDFVSAGTHFPVTISGPERMIYALKAHIVIKLGLKDRADRENFSLRKNKLSVDTTRQSADHSDTIDKLQARLHRALCMLKGEVEGVRVE